MLLIPLQPKPNQTLGIMLGGQPCEINIFQKSTGLFASLFVQNKPIVTTRLVRHGVGIVRQSYLGFGGDLVMIDTQGENDPNYLGLGTRWQLYYVTAGDLS